MPLLSVSVFDGIYPRTAATRLAPNQAQEAQNVKLYSGELRYWQGEVDTYTPAMASVRSLYLLYGSVSSIWLTWNVAGVDVVPGPLADTTDFRVYFTGAGSPRKTNFAMASAGGPPYPGSYLEMGVPAPAAAPTVVSSSHSAPVEDRVYVYTYLSTFGALTEESGPSPPSAIVGVDVPGTTTVTVSGFSAPPAGHYNITGINIYRSVAGATTANYEFVANIAVATTNYVDTLLTANLGQVLPSLGWLPPPAGLQGLITIGQTGVLAGFVGNTVYFSEPFAPHAWPLAYAISLPYDVVGLSVTAGDVVVMTKRYPYLISGATPGQMSEQQLPIDEPCIARSTIASDENGVVYASPNGLVSIGAAGEAVITTGLYRRTDWQAINPSLMKGIIYDSQYFGIFTIGSPASPSIVLNANDTPKLSTLTLNAAAAYKDGISGNLYVVDVDSNHILQIDADANNPLPYTWTSKRFVTPQGVPLSAMKVDADYSQIADDAAYQALVAADIAANTALFAAGPILGSLNDEPVNVLAINDSIAIPIPLPSEVRTLTIKLYGDGQLIGVFPCTSFDPIRLPAFKAREIYFTVEGNIHCTSVSFATTMRELDPQSVAQSMQSPTLWQ
ncbi:MAG: hypothetical protein ACXWCO_00770 [Caldimonas sp.]